MYKKIAAESKLWTESELQEKNWAGLPTVGWASPKFSLQFTFGLQFTFRCNSLAHDLSCTKIRFQFDGNPFQLGKLYVVASFQIFWTYFWWKLKLYCCTKVYRVFLTNKIIYYRMSHIEMHKTKSVLGHIFPSQFHYAGNLYLPWLLRIYVTREFSS